LRTWKKHCEANWREYADKHGYDLLCLDRPLDTSDRANKRSPSWQKCLILSQDFSQDYERIVWVDSDVLVNIKTAPSIVEDVPIDKVGAAELFCYSKQAGSSGHEAMDRMFDYWKQAVINPRAEDYYTKYGLPNGFDTVVQAGVLVASPAHHRSIFEKVYYNYEEKGGPEWHYEMRPLSYELLKGDLVHWIDPRFNLLWLDEMFLHYPFLTNPRRSRGILAKIINKMGRLGNGLSRDEIRHACVGVTFLNSYFLHFGGSELRDMQSLDTTLSSWRDCVI
jgi:hypothetical protein